MGNGLRMTAERVEEINAKNRAARGIAPPVAVEKRKVDARKDPRAVERKKSEIEVIMEFDIQRAGIATPQRNYRFHPGRKLELDFAWPMLKLAVEVQGMAHRIKEKFERDIEKRALAQMAGWTVLEVSGSTIRDGRAIDWLQVLMKQATEAPMK